MLEYIFFWKKIPSEHFSGRLTSYWLRSVPSQESDVVSKAFLLPRRPIDMQPNREQRKKSTPVRHPTLSLFYVPTLCTVEISKDLETPFFLLMRLF